MPVTPVGFSASNKGHISYFATEALLARVLSVFGRINAELQATDMISSNKYTLLSNANYVSGSTSFRTQNNSESIFDIVFNITNIPTMTKLDGSTFTKQRDSLSTIDLAGIKSLYS